MLLYTYSVHVLGRPCKLIIILWPGHNHHYCLAHLTAMSFAVSLEVPPMTSSTHRTPRSYRIFHVRTYIKLSIWMHAYIYLTQLDFNCKIGCTCDKSRPFCKYFILVLLVCGRLVSEVIKLMNCILICVVVFHLLFRRSRSRSRELSFGLNNP